MRFLAAWRLLDHQNVKNTYLKERAGRHSRCGCLQLTALALILLELLISGCAAETQRPAVELSATALAPVGATIPVYIRRNCTANCGFNSFGLTRGEVAAFDQSGKYVQAMAVSDAAEQAGGAQKLLDALNSGEGNTFYLTRKTLSSVYDPPLGLGLILLPGILAYTGWSAFNPEMVEEQRLEEISIAEGRYGSRQEEGWVFFPVGKYTQVKISYDWLPSLTGEEQSEIVKAPWGGSTAALVTKCNLSVDSRCLIP